MRTVAALMFTCVMAAQDAGFDVESRLVMVPVMVTDRKGRTVDGLEAADFALLDNGRSQKVVVDTFTTGQAPIALIVAVQASGISVPALEKVRKIGAMIQPLITGERGCAGVLAFSEQIRWLVDCTKDPDPFTGAFQRLSPGENKSARMFDALREAVAHLRKFPNSRRVVLLISESRDRGSETGLEDALLNAQAAGVAVYAVTYSTFATAFTTKASKVERPPEKIEPRSTRTEPLSAKGRVPIPPAEQRADILGGLGELARLGQADAANALTGGTGGARFSFARQKGLEEAIEKLGAELHSQYVLSFTPVEPEPGYHKLEVQVKGRPNSVVRARPAYWSMSGPVK